MAEIEQSLPIFRGVNDRVVNRNDFVRLFADVFDTLLYEKLQIQTTSRPVDRSYTNNKIFWDEALNKRLFQGLRVQLKGFHLTEWIPSAPGRYFTPNAHLLRESAQELYGAYGKPEYLPLGKNYMILGGVGSVRLKAKLLDTNNTYILGASSTGISHQGIPVAMFESEYRQVMHIIRKYGGCYANLIGTIQILPVSTSLIQYDREIPRYCLFLEKIEIQRPSLTKELLITAAITFPSSYHSYDRSKFSRNGYPNDFEKSWAFCSFKPSSDDKSLEVAVAWLNDYARRYSDMASPPILSDFDEHYQHFDIPIEFSLSRLFSGTIDTELINLYQSFYGFSINVQELSLIDNRKGVFVSGDQFNMSGSFQNVNIKSQLTNVVQSISALPNTDQKTKNELVKLTTQLGELLQQVPPEKAADAEKVSERVDSLMKEAQKPNPDKEKIEFNVNSLKRAATSIAEVLPAVLPIATQIATFIGSIIR